MTKSPRPLTPFGKDLDDLLNQAGRLSIREYADQAGVDYQYISQLRRMPDRHPGKLYVNLLKPFANLKILGVAEAHQLSIRHRGKPLTFTECKEIFPDTAEPELVASVKQALASTGDKTAVTPPSTLSPLYRRVFIGREAEVNQLKSFFDSAVTGQGSLVMVVGEPGIGKTAVCEQLADFVSTRRGKSLIGHCYSERSLSLPYLPFVEALGSYARSQDVIDLKKEVGAGAADIARIIPEVRERLMVEPRPKGDPEEERYRLMQAVVGFLKNIAGDQPLLLVLEDLHNADKGTLEMLTHVSRSLTGTRILIIGTYRDVEVDRTHPLSAALAEMRRIPVFNRVLLRGLNVDEVNRMLASITGQEMPLSLTEAIYRQTEGNPLFVQEVIRYLFEDGVISPQGEVKQRQKDLPVEMHIPDGLRDVIGKRLSSLSEQCNRVLAVASVIGREFPLMLLEKVTDLPDEDLFKAFEEAKKAAVIEEKTGVGATVNYRFAHAFFKQTLYEEIIAPRKIRLHQQVARAIEEIYKNRLEEHAAQLAEHFSHSSDSADLKKAVNYGEIAAKRAMDVYASGEAVRLLDQAIKVQEILAPEDKAKKCDLLLDLCDALLAVPDTRRILDKEAPVAFSLAEAIGDSSRSIRTCETAQSAMFSDMAGLAFSDPKFYEWTERLDHYAKPGTVERARTDAYLGMAIMMFKRHPKTGKQLLDQALELARRLGDPKTLLGVGGLALLSRQLPQAAEENLKLAEEMMSSSRAGIRLWNMSDLFDNMLDPFLTMGMRQRVEEGLNELRAVTKQTGLFSLWLDLAAWDAMLMYMDGHLEDVINIGRQILSRGEEAGVPRRADNVANIIDFRAKYYLGYDLEALERSYRIDIGDRISTWHNHLCILCLILANLGRNKEASEIIERIVVRRLYMGTADDLVQTWHDIMFMEVCVLIGHRQAAELLLNRFKGTKICTTGRFYTTVVPRHLGAACALLGRYEEARKYYDEAIKVCMEMRFRPEMALTRFQFAELLLEHYPNEKKEAVEHLDFCIKEFKDMKMQPSLERALRHKEILKA